MSTAHRSSFWQADNMARGGNSIRETKYLRRRKRPAQSLRKKQRMETKGSTVRAPSSNSQALKKGEREGGEGATARFLHRQEGEKQGNRRMK